MTTTKKNKKTKPEKWNGPKILNLSDCGFMPLSHGHGVLALPGGGVVLVELPRERWDASCQTETPEDPNEE